MFSKSYQERTRYLRVIKGLHGFHVYATEYWTEYLLSHARCASGHVETDSLLFILACRLANKLNETIDPMATEEIKTESNGLDERIALLRQHPILYKHVEGALKGGSLKRLEAELFPEDGKIAS